MALHALDFPIEIWVQVCTTLAIPDLLSLRSVHSSVRRFVESNEVWAPLVRQRWFSSDDSRMDLFHSIEEMRDYYIKRNELDKRIVKTLKKRPFVMQDGWWLSSLGEDAVPVLVQMKKDKSDLTTRYYASSALDVIRMRMVHKSLKEYFEDEQFNKPAPLEDMYLKLCLYDREYDTLLGIRRAIIDSTIKHVEENPLYQSSKTTTAKVLVIITTLASEIRRRVDSGFTDNTLENFVILRFYAGETEGTQPMQFAVIQRIASLLNIETTISKSFLIVKDPTVRSGHTYISLKKDLSRPKVFSLHEIYSFIRRSNPRDPINTLTELTVPLTIPQVLISLLEFRHTHSLAHSQELMQGSYMYRDAYPISKNHIRSSMVDVYALCLCALGRTRGMEGLDAGEFTHLAGKFPFMAAFVDDELFVDRRLGFKLDALTSFKREAGQDRQGMDGPSEGVAPVRIGEVVLHAVGYYSIVCGCSVNGRDVFYSLTNGIEARQERVTPVKKGDITTELVQLLTNEYDVGRYFQKFDANEGLFIPTAEHAKAYKKP